jgi:hypothetical protein
MFSSSNSQIRADICSGVIIRSSQPSSALFSGLRYSKVILQQLWIPSHEIAACEEAATQTASSVWSCA